MNKTVEKGKTLLVDGPASVTVVSGKAKVFGLTLGSDRKVVVREGKRLPFAVEEATTFDVSLGEGAGMDEVDGDTVPVSWAKAYEELSSIQTKPVTVLVVGTVDSGKTSFCTFLINKLASEKRRVAVLDGDLGQSDVGPPCTVAYTFVTRPLTDLFSLEAKNAFFVGLTSPTPAIYKVVEGLASLRSEILTQNPDVVIINTDGWVEGEEAVNYKIQLIENLNPDIVFCIKQGEELTPMVNALQRFRTVIVESPSAIRQRSREKRKNLRELGYMKYLKNAKIQSILLGWVKIEEDTPISLSKNHMSLRQSSRIYELLGMKPLHLAEMPDKICLVIGRDRWISPEGVKKVEEFTRKRVEIIWKGEEEGLLTALYDSERKFLGIGVLREIHYRRKTVNIFTPVSKGISIISIGKVKLGKDLKEVPTLLTPENQQNPLTLNKLG
jgi:polynucleotide 5'-hydroxyl-kinase GRC3/NOL9